MSTNYQSTKEVPLDAIIARLRELSGAIIRGRDAQAGEFTMRIPAECDRDADLVLSEAANRLNAMQTRVAELVMAVNLACDNALEDDPDVWRKVDRALASDSSASWLLRQKADAVDELKKELASDYPHRLYIRSILQGMGLRVDNLRAEADKADKAGDDL
jgi:hypothetical protein